MSILVIAEHNNESLHASTLNTLSAATKISDDITVLVAGSGCSEVAKQASAVPVVKKVLHADGEHLAHQLAENMGAVIVEAVNTHNFTHVLAPATTTGKNLLPRVAALIDVQPISDVISIESDDTFMRPIYAGNVIATVQTSDPVKVITVRGTAFDPVENTGGSSEVVAQEAGSDSGKSSFTGEQLAQSDRPELTAADIVISGGRGLQNGANFDMLYTLADKLSGAVGASRAAVDAGFVPNDMQVGQTGKIVAPSLYMAVGISGAIQHLAGMKDSKVIVAVNKDEDAPIFQVADYGLVADLFDVVPELIDKL